MYIFKLIFQRIISHEGMNLLISNLLLFAEFPVFYDQIVNSGAKTTSTNVHTYVREEGKEWW